MSTKEQPVLAIDPGSEKCGLAIVYGNNILLQEVVPRSDLLARVVAVLPQSGPIVIGDKTGSKQFLKELMENLPEHTGRIVQIDEHLSSVEARTLYWQFNSPKGWRRLLPRSLQVPPVPIDDYVAVILARRFQALMTKNGK